MTADNRPIIIDSNRLKPGAQDEPAPITKAATQHGEPTVAQKVDISVKINESMVSFGTPPNDKTGEIPLILQIAPGLLLNIARHWMKMAREEGWTLRGNRNEAIPLDKVTLE